MVDLLTNVRRNILTFISLGMQRDSMKQMFLRVPYDSTLPITSVRILLVSVD